MSILFQFLARFPLPVLHFLGAFLGALVFLASARERHRARENLALAFPSGVPAGVAFASAKAAGRALAELPYLWIRPMDEVLGRIVSVEGWEHIDAARARGDALMMLTPHIGCFELAGQICGSRFPIVCLYRPPKNPSFKPLMVNGRTRGGVTLAATDTAGVKKMLRALRQQAAIGLLPDQVPQSGEGIWVPFFGKLAYTMTLAARLSALDNVTTLYIYVTREAGGRYRVYVRPPKTPLTGPQEARAQQINQEVESIVREFPAQYFWAYNRYKVPHADAAADLIQKEKGV